MNTVYFDAPATDEQRRPQLFEGQIFVYSPRASVQALVDFAREFIEPAFGNLDPVTAQHALDPAEYERVLASFKPAFINHPHSKELVQSILRDFGCDPAQTYFDVPRMRTATSHAYLNRGLAYSFEAHRDTWFSGPMNQINWWLPIYGFEPGNGMAFHPQYWAEPVPNGSEGFNCRAWDAEGARLAASPGTPDRRVRPQPFEALAMEPQLRLVMPVGGLMVFSAAHLHSTVPNHTGRSRFSIDFRMVNLADVKARRAAPNHDTRCTGTTLDMYYRLADLGRIPAEWVQQYEQGTPLLTTRQPALTPAG
ncbi:hypothetical protein [Hymenobacter algoricola]|uniref:Phytanoyl-CoA dioxygenase family protein n=1 Tax=Hymenobacter algoricola TaxID=486267 RepID=A0ABP7MNS7_9BACT